MFPRTKTAGYKQYMMKTTHRQALIAMLAAAALGACAHHTAPVRTLQAQLTPFEQTRTQAISLVTKAKRVMDPMSINQLEVAYTDLEVKANSYTGFIVESVDVGALDVRKNATYAADLTKAIDGFNQSYNTLRTSALSGQPPVADLSAGWVPSFANEQKTAVAERIKRETVWPNFEDIATERLNLPQISRSH
jgi:hypothetical protein